VIFGHKPVWTTILSPPVLPDGFGRLIPVLKNFTAFTLGLPSVRSLPALIRRATSWVVQFMSFATCPAIDRMV
jgi:hypothetical protein